LDATHPPRVSRPTAVSAKPVVLELLRTITAGRPAPGLAVVGVALGVVGAAEDFTGALDEGLAEDGVDSAVELGVLVMRLAWRPLG
jgi:hypothetical protein